MCNKLAYTTVRMNESCYISGRRPVLPDAPKWSWHMVFWQIFHRSWCPAKFIRYLQIRGKRYKEYKCYLLVTTANVFLKCSLQWRPNEHNVVSIHRRLDCLRNRLFQRRWKKTSKSHVIGLCEGNALATGGFPSQMASNAGNVSIWWRHHGIIYRKQQWTSTYCLLTALSYKI